MGLGNDEVRDILARAAEIESVTRHGGADMEAVMQAAEEVGISRTSVERALREHMKLPARPPAVGELTFAKSADDKYYVAEVLSISDNDFRVRFLRGSEHAVSIEDLRPCSFLPGERIVCQWPHWGAWTCTVVSYDANKRMVTVTDGWSENRAFPIEEVWVTPPRVRSKSSPRARVYAALLVAGATAGAVIGSIITALILD